MITRLLHAARDFVRTGTLKLRSSKWHEVRDQWLKEHPTCAACGGTEKLQVHHCEAFHLNPARELDPTNFITLCEAEGGKECHLHVGHLGCWRNVNPNVRQDAATLLAGGGVKDWPQELR